MKKETVLTGKKSGTFQRLEKSRGIFFEIGLIVALALALTAFEWKSCSVVDETFDNGTDITIDEEIIDITYRKKPPLPPEPKLETNIFKIVQDDDKDANDFKVDSETSPDEKILPQPIDPDIDDPTDPEPEFILFPEVMPAFPGGDLERLKLIKGHISYPKIANETGIQGTVYIAFIVEADGSLTNWEILKGIGGGCDEEALRVAKLMPPWHPGKQRTKPVRVKMSMPIKFTLSNY